MKNLQKNNEEYSLSIYSGELTMPCIIKQIGKIKMAFPSLPIEWHNLLSDRVKELNFNDDRLIAAVNNLIDTCVYPQPTIANIIGFGKNIKLLTHKQMLDETTNDPDVFKKFKAIKTDKSFPLWASNGDIETYRLELWDENSHKNE